MLLSFGQQEREARACRCGAHAAVRAAPEEPFAHLAAVRGRSGPLPRPRRGAARRRLPRRRRRADRARHRRCRRRVMEVSADRGGLARAAYHLGNRHCPVEIGADWLRFPPIACSPQMLLGTGLRSHGGVPRRSNPRPGRTRRDIITTRARQSTRASSTTSGSARRRGDERFGLRSNRAGPGAAGCSSRARALPIGAYSYSQGLECVSLRREASATPPQRRPGSATRWSSSSLPAKPPSSGACSMPREAKRLVAGRRMERLVLVPRARRRSSAPRPSRWDRRWQTSRPTSSSSMRRRPRPPAAMAPVTLPGAYALIVRGSRRRRRRR